MRNFFTKSLAVSAVAGVALVGGAGMATADTGDTVESTMNETTNQVQDNRIADSGNVSLDNIANDAVNIGDVASGNNVLSGIDTSVTDNLDGFLSGNNADVDANPDVDSTVDADASNSSQSTTNSNEDNESLLGGLL
ncbi:hypothetical protein [Arthrobacter pigmenti]